MITNLIAAVTITLVTNVSESHPQIPRPSPNIIPVTQPWGGIVTTNGSYIVDSVWRGFMDDPSRKTVTTTISQRKLLSFEWAGQLRQIENLEMINTSSRTYTLKTTQEWVEDQGSATMGIPISTNSFYFLFGTNHVVK